MNYIVLNGVKSNTVKGLLISSLPPISKPLMRTEIEQVDGRDGDIVTPLGYSSYNKDISIGLYGDFDIDDVIAYFATSGTVTFSNEPDKYYNYAIYNQIDFERLIRFRTATVTFHVQPFKYSAVGDDVTANPDKYNGSNGSVTKNGITIDATGGDIAISGTGASGYTEIYLPINPITLAAGDYTLNLTANGTGANACAVRLIGELPTDADTFGDTYKYLQNDATVTQAATLAAAKTFNYLWFYVSPGVSINLTLDVSVIDNGVSSVTLINLGNTVSRPTIQVCGSGNIVLSINGNQVLGLSLGDSQNIIIDAAEMNAYYNGVFLNRSVTGDYSDVVLNPGTNVLSWDGTIETLEVTKISRWI